MISYIKRILKKNKCIKRKIDEHNRKKYEQSLLKREKIITEQGETIVKQIEAILRSSNLVYFATCGTLLGLIREKKLLKNDYDMDYGVLIKEQSDWNILKETLNTNGFKKIRDFVLDGRITEETYRSEQGVEIDFFGHFIEDDELCFYSYDRLPDEDYPTDEDWTTYILKNGRYKGVKIITTEVGEVSVPEDAEDYLTYNYNDNWRIPDPTFKANTGKGCSKICGKYGQMRQYK